MVTTLLSVTRTGRAILQDPHYNIINRKTKIQHKLKGNIMTDTTALETTIVEDVETEEIELSLEDIVRELTDTVYGPDATVTPYKVAKIVNGAFAAMGVAKEIPPQMMYNYSRN